MQLYLILVRIKLNQIDGWFLLTSIELNLAKSKHSDLLMELEILFFATMFRNVLMPFETSCETQWPYYYVGL